MLLAPFAEKKSQPFSRRIFFISIIDEGQGGGKKKGFFGKLRDESGGC